MPRFDFQPHDLPAQTETLRAEVREFLEKELADYPPGLRSQSWQGFSPEFSQKMGAKGWIAMTWPRQYGGHERSALERYVVLEEVLAAGAPVAAHWIADRQSGPLLLRYGTQEQRDLILPAIARGECYFCIGMSEPDSGSDLASIRTKGEWSESDQGWIVNGTKVWTTNAHRCQWMVALIRTEGDPKSRHEGLTQFLVGTDTPGLTIRPIRDLAGGEHFTEVVFEDALIPDTRRVGEEGAGWRQVMAELAFERSGPERYLSSFELVRQLVRLSESSDSERLLAGTGRMIAHLATLRQMSISVASMLEAGEDPALEAAVVKDAGGTFEQEIPEIAHDLVGREPSAESPGDLEQVLSYLTQNAPSFSLRGGTREILRGIMARGLGLR
jgi:alkylation response protein AidB-like acyl-CoA dehydrogenase